MSIRPAWLAGVAVLVLAWHAVAVRLEPGASPSLPVGPADPTTGALLLDLDDDADADERAGVAAELRRAIEPAAWPAGEGALGKRLSGPAQLYRIQPPAAEVDDILRALADEEVLEGVERERMWRLPDVPPTVARPEPGGDRSPVTPWRPGRFVPNDPYYRYQWHLDQIGMPEAWARQRGRGAVVAVVDTGVLYRNHGRFRRAPDLAATRFVPGRDLVDGDDSPDDEHGHGTHVAGTIAQSTHNGVGVAGVAPAAAIMPVRVLDRRGFGRWGAVAAGIRWATDHGADVINLSLGGGMPSQTIRRAVDHAHAHGVVVVAAAGNDGRPAVGYPAGHRHVIAVGAVRYDRELTFYSSHGRGLDLVAPGGDLRVDQNGDGLPDGVLQNTMVGRDPARHDYVTFMGTSMAAPHVAGAAAVLRAAGIRDPDAIERVLEESAETRGDRRRYGAGLLQVGDALALAGQGLGALRGLGAAGLALGLLLGLRRRRRLDVALGGTLAWTAVAAGGLAALPWHALPGAGPLLTPVVSGLSGMAAVAGPAGALVLCALLPLVLAALLLGVRPLRPAVVGVALGLGAAAWLEAALPVLGPFGWAAPAGGLAWVVAGLAALAVGRLAATRP